MANGHTHSQPAIQPPAAAIQPPPIADAERDDGRTNVRADAGFTRLRPREDHERYALDKTMMVKGMDYFWGAVRVQGQPNPRFTEYLRAGWQVARAGDYPEVSGIDANIDPRLIELNFLKAVNKDDPIENRGLMLLVRPKELSKQARDEDLRKANRQVDDQMNRLRATSRRAIGDKTQISRHVERGANLVPDDDQVEE